MKKIIVISLLMIGRMAIADLAGDITAKSVQNPSAVQYSSTNDTQGREKKAANAQNTGKQGNAAAIATGAALTAAGVPMVASPILSVEIAGAELLAKAALEFAQAGADKKNANTNGSQKDLLLNSQGQNVTQDKAGTPSKSILTPQLDQLLTNRGVNAQDFANRLQSGELTDPTEILKAMNADISGINEQTLAEGAQLASSQLATTMGAKPEPLGDEPTRKIDYDKSPSSSTDANPLAAGVSFAPAAGGVGAAIASASGSSAQSALSTSAKPPVAPIVPLSSEAQASTLAKAAANSLIALQGSGLSLDPSELNVLEQFGPGAAVGALNNPAVAQVFLDRVGIQKLNPKQNIFQTAHRNFRNYGKWRKETKVAARRLP